MASSELRPDTIPDNLRAAKESAVAQFLSKEPAGPIMAFAAHSNPKNNVVGVGIGRKIKNGKATARHSVRFYVKRKLDVKSIDKRFLLPKKIGNVPTDVIETGEFRPFGDPSAERAYKRPAQPGCSVGFQFTGSQAGTVMAGTFGAVVEVNGIRYILSNNHVLANQNALPIGSAIFQPGLLDKNAPGKDAIAKLAKFVPLKASGSNKVDCALAKVDAGKLISPIVMDKVGALKSALPITAAVAMKVEKTGRTTGYTTGTVTDVAATMKVTYDLGVLTFTDQILIIGGTEAFSDAGDSGSLIVDRKTKRATGLLFAGSASHTIANHMEDVLDALKATIVIG
jgi:hypothetical protein